jgi:hypothetical protein
VLATFCWTKSLLCNVAAFTGMLLYPESTLQLCSSRRFCEVFKEVYFGSLSAVQTTWSPVWMLISQQHPSGRRGIPVQTLLCQSIIRSDDENFPSRRPSVSRSFEQVQDCIRPDVMVNRPDSLQSLRRSQCSSASVRTTWLYRPDAIQCLTSIRVSDSRHGYG